MQACGCYCWWASNDCLLERACYRSQTVFHIRRFNCWGSPHVIFLKLFAASFMAIVIVGVHRKIFCSLTFSNCHRSSLQIGPPSTTTTSTGLMFNVSLNPRPNVVSSKIPKCSSQFNSLESIPKGMIDDLFHGYGTYIFPTETFRYQFHTIGRYSYGQ